MILKKPYAFFIKIFKPLHFIISLMIFYLIVLSSRILDFLNNYLHSPVSVVGEQIYSKYINSLIYIIPIIVIVLSFIILGVMFRKKKPVTFYFISIFSFIAVIVINSYTANFLKVMEESIVSVSSTKLIHDLVLINIIIQSVILIFYLIRGMGLNIKKFDFDSDLAKFDINQSDEEEFEVNVSIDFDETKRKRNEKLRKLKYTYIENRFKINVAIFIIVLLIVSIVSFTIIKANKSKKVEGQMYVMSRYNIGVNSTTILDKDFKGDLITKKGEHLVVVDVKLSSNFEDEFLYLNNFNLNIGDAIFKPTLKYSDKLIDLGNTYNEDILSSESKDYLLVYVVSDKFIESSMSLSYNGLDYNISINLKPISKTFNGEVITKNLGEEISFDVLGDIKLNIDSFDINREYIIDYDYCIKDNDCIKSKEYLRPTINTNFDKSILKLNLTFSNNSNIKAKTFFDFFNTFGYIQYEVKESKNVQKLNFEQIKSRKVNNKNVEYIGVNSNIGDATRIKFVFNIRGYSYEYILK